MGDAVVLAVPDQPGKQYREKIVTENGLSYHLLRQLEEVRLDVEPIKLGDGEYRTLSDIERVEI